MQDIPGVFYGTLLQRLDRLFLPGFLKRFIRGRLLASRRRKLAHSDRCAPIGLCCQLRLMHMCDHVAAASGVAMCVIVWPLADSQFVAAASSRTAICCRSTWCACPSIAASRCAWPRAHTGTYPWTAL